MDCREITSPPLSVQSLAGLWIRSLMSWADGRRDSSTRVLWLQGERHFIDLRQPAALPALSGVKCLNDLTRADCLALSCQEGFAGVLRTDAGIFEWVRMIDYQPAQPTPDAGFLHWDKDVLIETAKDQTYTEYWHRQADDSPAHALSVLLEERATGCRAMFVQVGHKFMFARERMAPLPAGMTLHDAIAQALDDEQARQHVDCEISFGHALAPDGPLVIRNSTLPWKAGAEFRFDLSGKDTLAVHDIAPNGTPIMRTWHRMCGEGDC